MKVIVLGGSGQIGARLMNALRSTDWCEVLCASRGHRLSRESSQGNVVVDTRDENGLTKALRDVDCVVNCIAGDADSISEGARTLARAAAKANCRKIVHLSTMSVYGRAEGTVDESSPLDPHLGWYAEAKCAAEKHIESYVDSGAGEAVILRPGCVYGPGSELWVGRIGRWLRSRRIGDLGSLGDGWSNLVHVDDVCAAVLSSLRLDQSPGSVPRFNLAAPDSPRWNEYFVDLAIAIGAHPVKRVTKRQLTLDTKVLAPPLKVLEIISKRTSLREKKIPDAMPPALLRFFSQCIRLDASSAEVALGIQWKSYQKGLGDSASWFCETNPA